MTIAPQDLQAIHRIHSELVRQRTAKVNQVRGLLAEYGLVVDRQVATLRRALPELLENAEIGLSFDFRGLLEDLRQDPIRLDERVAEMDKKVHTPPIVCLLPSVCRLSRGLVQLAQPPFFVRWGDGKQFKRGRDLAAWLGLTPRQQSSGGKDRLLGISKRGDTYLRTLLIQGAKSVLKVVDKKTDPRSLWLQNLCARKHKNIAAVALANKNARIAWALLSNETSYLPEGKPA